MKEMKAGLRLDLYGNMMSQSKVYAEKLNNLFKTGGRGAQLLSKSASLAGNGIERLGNKYTAFLTGAGTIMAVKNVADMSAKLTRLGINAGKSKEDMANLNEEIYRIAQQRDININPDELLAASTKMLEGTKNLEFTQRNLEKLAIVISATGADGEYIGSMASSMFSNMDIQKAEDMIDIFAMLKNQGDIGGLALKEFASQSERLMAAYSKTGRKGIDAISDMNAMLQMAKMTAATSEQAGSDVEAMLKTLNNPSTRKMLKKAGISIMDENDPKRMRSMVELSKELIVKANGSREKLRRVFDERSMEAITSMIDEFNNTKGFASVDKIMAASRDSSVLIADSARAATEFNAVLTSLKTAFKQYANNKLAEPLSRLANALNRLSPEQIQNYIELAGKIAAGIGVALLTLKTLKLGAGIYNFFKSPLGAGKALASMSSPMPVYVVNNMPGVGGAGINAGGGKGGLVKKGVLAASVVSLAQTGDVLDDFVNKGVSQSVQDYKDNWGGSDWVNPSKMAAVAGDYIGEKIGNMLFGNETPVERMKRHEEEAKKRFANNSLVDKSDRVIQFIQQAEQTKTLNKNESYIHLELDTKTGKATIKGLDTKDSPQSITKIDFTTGGAKYAL